MLMLIIFAGLSGVGKTTIARELAGQIGAVYMRIDSIEQALRDSGAMAQPLNDAGYRVGYALAEDNLRLGRTVVADSVNPLCVTRQAWVDVGKRVGVGAIEVEVQCSDPNEHRRRVEERVSDIPGFRLPTWNEVVSREYHPWTHEHVVIDTAGCALEKSVSMIREMLRNR
jgi:predicted kinase